MPKGKSLLPRKIQRIKCAICEKEYSIVGMFTHLRDAHQTTPDQYVSFGNPEYRPKKLQVIKGLHTCMICGMDEFNSQRMYSQHVTGVHKMDMKEYVFRYHHNGIQPKCICGCGTEVSVLPRPPYQYNYVNGHHPNGMTGKRHKISSREKMSEKALERGITAGRSDTGIEIHFKELLRSWNIQFETQVKIPKIGIADFYIPEKKLYIEIDGVYYHPTKVERMNLMELYSVRSQIRKSTVKNMVRVRSNDLKNVKKFDDIFQYNHVYDMTFGFETILMEANYFKKLNPKRRGEAVSTLSDLIRIIHPSFKMFDIEATIRLLMRSEIDISMNRIIEHGLKLL